MDVPNHLLLEHPKAPSLAPLNEQLASLSFESFLECSTLNSVIQAHVAADLDLVGGAEPQPSRTSQ